LGVGDEMKLIQLRIITPRIGKSGYSWMTGLNVWSLGTLGGLLGMTLTVLGFGVLIEWERKA
jgi:hypothetical protein